MAEKKISFGFSKSIKPKILSGIATSKNEQGVELIQCLEGQTIKIVGEVKKEEQPLIIPLKNNTKTSAALAALQALKDTIEGNEAPAIDNVVQKIEDNEIPKTLEQRAAQEILNSLVENQQLDAETNKVLSLPLKSDELPLDGATESTLNDYEEIPISQFGLAMLRGMGYKDEVKSDKKVIVDEPMVRPKGMGLGADKLVKPKTLLVPPAKDEVLEFKKSACVRVLLGKHKDLYGQNNLPVNISLLDYQISRYSSPALDLAYFFFTSTDKNLRDSHYQELIQLYHKSLSTNVTKLGSDPNKLFSYNDLQDQLKNFGRYGLIIAPMLLNIITAKPDDIPDLDNLAEDMVDKNKSFEDGLKAFSGNDASIDKFNERIRDVVRDIIQLGYY